MKATLRNGLLLVGTLGIFGCGGGADIDAGGGLGATPGGEQDVALLRESVARGVVPLAAAMTVPGFLAEHDLPLEAPVCTQVLCITAGVGVTRAADTNKNEVFVQLGFSSGLEAATFERDPLNLMAVVDRSGSMHGEKMEAAKTALHKLVDQLGPEDRFGIIIFDDRFDLLVEPAAVTSKAALHAKVSTITDRGATDIESALRRGFELVRAGTSATRRDRVILMTDAQPNTGRTGTMEFQNLVNQYAAEGVGLTALGVGIDFGQELALAITHARGGNYFFLRDRAKIETVFDRDFDFLVTPLAYDLHMVLRAAVGYRIKEVYGLPASPEGRTVVLDAATLFLSRNRGAILLRMEPSGDWGDGRVLAETELSYETAEASMGGERVTQQLSSGYGGETALGGDTVWFSQRGVERTVALVNAAVAVRRGLELYHQGQRSQGAAEVDKARSALLAAAGADALNADLRTDATMCERLAGLMRGTTVGPQPSSSPQPSTSPRPSTSPQPGAQPDEDEPYRLYGCSAAAGAGDGGRAGAGAALLLAAIILARALSRRSAR